MADSPSRPVPSGRWLYVLFGLIVLGLIVWSSVRVLRETPSRQVGVEIPGQGYVNLILFTDPFPPLATGKTEIRLFPETDRGVALGLGSGLPFQIGVDDSSQHMLEGVFAENTEGNGYRASVQFPTPDSYWLEIEVSPDTTARFRLTVEPAQ